MISNAFKSAVTNEANQKTAFAQNISSGGKDALSTIAGIVGLSAMASGGASSLAYASAHNFAGRVGGIGGNIMLLSMEERKENIIKQRQQQQNLSAGVAMTADLVKETLGNNPINRTAQKSLSTVFEKITGAIDEGVVDKKGKISTSMGDIDINSPLGQRIIKGDDENDND